MYQPCERFTPEEIQAIDSSWIVVEKVLSLVIMVNPD